MGEASKPVEETVFYVPLWPVHKHFVLDLDFQCVLQRVTRELFAVLNSNTCVKPQNDKMLPETAQKARDTEDVVKAKTRYKWRCCWICLSPIFTKFTGTEDAVRCRQHLKALAGRALELERRKLEERMQAEALLLSKFGPSFLKPC